MSSKSPQPQPVIPQLTKSSADLQAYADKIVLEKDRAIMDTLFKEENGQTIFTVNTNKNPAVVIIDLVEKIRSYEPAISKEMIIDLLNAAIQKTIPKRSTLVGLKSYLESVINIFDI